MSAYKGAKMTPLAVVIVIALFYFGHPMIALIACLLFLL
jgi:hypothetical protein